MPDSKILIGWIDGGQTNGAFTHALAVTTWADGAGPRRIVGTVREKSGTNVAYARNRVCEVFLEHPDQPEWLVFIDTDMVWTPDQLRKLLATADPATRPILGALCFGADELQDGTVDTFPTIWTAGEEGLLRWSDPPDDALVKCNATGAAFLVIHRSVLEKLRAEGGKSPLWSFQQLLLPGTETDHLSGEDTGFCLKAGRAGFPTHVLTSVCVDHIKGPLVLNLETHRQIHAQSRTVVIVPVKDRLDLTRRMLGQLKEQGGWDAVAVFDNGSGRETANWLRSQDWFRTFDAAGASIHDMWNAGLELAVQAYPRTNIIILNNDLELGPNFCHGLTSALRDNPDMWAVSPNYDQRSGPDIIPVQGICAGRYDGTGGLAGFAFCLRGEWVRASKYRFPTEAKWWYGDTDLALTITQRGGLLGIVRDTTVTHIDGGSQTARPVDWDEQIEKDAAWFHGKWAPEREQTPGPRRTGGLLTQTPGGGYVMASDS